MEDMKKNEFEMEFLALAENESLARIAVAAFIMPMDPDLEQINDVKTAVSEAVTNSIIHGYEKKSGKVYLKCKREGTKFQVEIIDKGEGMKDVGLAMEPLYTSKPEQDRSGMGFSFMEAFMDHLSVESQWGIGTKVVMEKNIVSREDAVPKTPVMELNQMA